MITVEIPLQDIIIDINQKVDLSAVPEEEALPLIVQAYQFLPQPLSVHIEGRIAIIQSTAKSHTNKKTARLFDRAAAAANRGRYDQAEGLYTQILAQAPDNVDARRNLGMAYLEQGDVAQAEKYLIETFNLDPQNAYTLLLLGNIYLSHKQDPDTALRFYDKAVQVSPEDPYILTNYGALLAKQELYTAADTYFQRALTADPAYPNAHYGLAQSYYEQGRLEQAMAALEALFDQPESVDIRSEPLYQEAWQRYRQINAEVARLQVDASMAHLYAWRERLEAADGMPIEIVQDDRINTTAKTEIAWHQHGRSSHIIRYRRQDNLITPHLIGHELQHIALEQAARAAGRNRFFITNAQTRQAAEQAISQDIHALKRSGLSPAQLETFLEQVINGLANQIFNTPLDMVIEHRLFHEHPALRPHQFASLYATHLDNRQVILDPQIKQIAPRLVFNANAGMNAAYALFMDGLFQGRTSYADDYQGTRYYRFGRELYGLFLEMQSGFKPGDEYTLVDEFAAVLRLEGWYTWRKDEPQPVEEAGGVTDEELLQSKQPAAVMYCLGALQRFDKMSRDEIYAIVSEIAVLGRDGLDYADADQKYTLQSLPNEYFSGLQLMCLMYVGFKDINPTLDTGMDLQAPYEVALKMHEEPE